MTDERAIIEKLSGEELVIWNSIGGTMTQQMRLRLRDYLQSQRNRDLLKLARIDAKKRNPAADAA